MKQKARRILTKYFGSIEGLLYWFGGTVTIAWCVIMFSVAHGLTRINGEPGFLHTIGYVGSLMFALGLKESRRELNGYKHKDYLGELWAVMVIANTFLILIECYTPFQFCPERIGPVVKEPSQLIPSLIGVVSVFGAGYIQLGLFVRNIFKRIIDKIKTIA